MNKHYFSCFKDSATAFVFKSSFILLFCCCTYIAAKAQTTYTLGAAADACVRNGSYSSINYGSDTTLTVKSSSLAGYTRYSYLKFSLGQTSSVSSAKIRIFGRNTDNTSNVTVFVYGIDNDSWTESTITWNNAPAGGAALSSVAINNQAKYYELDVTDFVKTQLSGDKVATFLIKDTSNQNKNLALNSKENSSNKPQLIISSQVTTSSANALLFIENPDNFPANDHFVFSKIQTPWTRDSIYAANHDSLRIRIHNKGMTNLIVTNLILSNSSAWKIDKIKGANYIAATSLPISITSGSYADLIVKFVATNQATRVKVLHDTLTIVSNDNNYPSKPVFLSGLWQKQGEGNNEPYGQEIINAFGLTTKTGFSQIDADKGDTLAALKGDEIRPSYFVRADASKPVSIIQLAAYHGCCNTAPETISWYTKGSTDLKAILTHVLKDGQTLLPRKGLPATTANATFSPSSAFGLKIGEKDYTDAAKNPEGRTGIKVWKAIDGNGNIIQNAYVIGNDYLATPYTNYDYQDNMYFIQNVRPEKGTVYFSKLSGTPSALDFGEKVLQTVNSLTLNIASLGKTYSDGSKDPVISISSVAITGENKSEFSALMPLKTTLNPQEQTSLTVSFKPATQGLKIADLLIYYKNSATPIRIPLYGIAKASNSVVNVKYRINSGSATSVVISNKTWSADTVFAVGALQPYTSKLTSVAGTDEDRLYFKEQHSDSAKKPWSYVLPVSNGNYVVRLHFAEIFWGVPGGNLNGGVGSRVMSVALEGQLRLINFDPTQEAGASATAIVKNIPVTVTDGKLNISFSSTVDRPTVCAVEVYSFSTTTAKPAPLNVEGQFDKAKVYPNPVQKILKVEFPPKCSGVYKLEMIDATGRVYEIGQINLPLGGSTMDINISKLSLKAGLYYLKIISEHSKPEVIKLLVE